MSDPRKRAEAEAIEWIILLQEDPQDPATRNRFEAWRRSPGNDEAWREAAAAYRGIGQTTPAHRQRWQKAAALPRPRPHVVRRSPLLAVGAMCAAAALVVSLRGTGTGGTGTAQLRHMTLADGSSVELGPDTTITFDISAHARTARLLRGEAWFEVRHNAARPFTVVAGPVRTVDVGTSFSVERAPSDTTVAVQNGAVDVMAADAATDPPRRLGAGDVETVSTDGHITVATLPPSLVGAWRDHRLVVQDRALGDVVDSIRGWYRGLVVIAPSVDTRRRVTGVYDVRDPVAALAALMQAGHGHVRRVTPWLAVLVDG